MCVIDVAHVCDFQIRLECASVLVGTRIRTRVGSSYMTDTSDVLHRTASSCQTIEIEDDTSADTPLISFSGSFDRLVLPALALVFPSRVHLF